MNSGGRRECYVRFSFSSEEEARVCASISVTYGEAGSSDTYFFKRVTLRYVVLVSAVNH